MPDTSTQAVAGACFETFWNAYRHCSHVLLVQGGTSLAVGYREDSLLDAGNLLQVRLRRWAVLM